MIDLILDPVTLVGLAASAVFIVFNAVRDDWL